MGCSTAGRRASFADGIGLLLLNGFLHNPSRIEPGGHDMNIGGPVQPQKLTDVIWFGLLAFRDDDHSRLERPLGFSARSPHRSYRQTLFAERDGEVADHRRTANSTFPINTLDVVARSNAKIRERREARDAFVVLLREPHVV